MSSGREYEYTFRAWEGSWGVVFWIAGSLESDDHGPPGATVTDSDVWLMIEQSVSEEWRVAIGDGVCRMASLLLAEGWHGVRVKSLKVVLTDYQLDGVEPAVMEWIAHGLAGVQLTVPWRFLKDENRYEFFVKAQSSPEL